MSKFLASIKAMITRMVFAAHAFIAIWQVTIFKNEYYYWYLCCPILLLFFEGVFTLTIKANQEWKWFCPSVFLYLASIVPAIWLLELDKVEKRLKAMEETLTNLTANTDFERLNSLIGITLPMPPIPTETWITVIEQFLMLILIIGRWMLPKGDLTRDQLSQLLLVYIGTAADIIEFFDSFKDDKIAAERILVLLTLAIWSWSLMQFTVVLTATKSRKSRLTSSGSIVRSVKGVCCSMDVWGIMLNICLQDAPFLVFRLLLILHFNIISYMNIFFTCKNTLVILLQLYRLYVVFSENDRASKKIKKKDMELPNISIISNSDMNSGKKPKGARRSAEKYSEEKKRSSRNLSESEDDDSEYENRPKKKPKNARKDTGYSTASSHTSNKNKIDKKLKGRTPSRDLERVKEKSSKSSDGRETKKQRKQRLERSDRETRISMEETSDESLTESVEEKSVKSTKKIKRPKKRPTTISTSQGSSE